MFIIKQYYVVSLYSFVVVGVISVQYQTILCSFFIFFLL